MKRGACLLALLGMTVHPVLAEDQFFATSRAGDTARPAATSNMAGLPAKAPQKFTRSTASTDAAGSAGQNDNLRNYYNELFGNTQAATPATSSINRTVAPTSTANVDPSAKRDIIHAEYRPDAAAQGSAIEQVKSERFSARAFPSQAESQAALPGSAAPEKPALEKAAPASPFETSSFATAEAPAAPAAAPKSTSSFTSSFKASSKSPAQTAMSPAGAADAAPRKGSVTFSRGVTSSRTASGKSTTAAGSAASSMAASPTMTLEWQKQTEVNVGQECTCHLVVKNTSLASVQNVDVQAYFPPTVRLVNASPAPVSAEKFLSWNISEIKAGEEQRFEITMIPMERGDINARADIRFSGSANGVFAVSEPMLNLEIEGPKHVLIGEPASHTVTVSNPGTGIANQVQIVANVSEGLEHARGQRLMMELGNLSPGESRSVRLALAAVKGGPQTIAVQAQAASGLVRTTNASVDVIAPMLSASIQGPGLRYMGRQGSYTMTVCNEGDAPTDNVQLRYKVPTGFDFVSADRGAQFDSATGLVSWFVGRMERGQKSEIKVTLVARQEGEFKHMVRATSEHGAIADAECMTNVEGTASLSISVKDLEDPVEIRTETSYEIRIRNEGSAGSRQVGLTCELPPGMTFVRAEGPAEAVCENSTVLFRELPELAAGQTATFKVHVLVTQPASLRFRAHVSSESVADPLTAEELTKFYGE
jgi:uncharacterized repeat protein (TIGR01451 family)